MTTDLIGTQIKQYRIETSLGDGGMGTVYRAFDLNLQRQVAVKLMHPHFARLPEFRARLTKEAQSAAKLDHPSIVKIFDFGESAQGLYIAMQYIDGGSLRSHLRRLHAQGKFLPFAQVMQIGVQIADALDYAHQRGLIHRDVKPGNILLKKLDRPLEEGDAPFRAVLTDFGLVKVLEGEKITETGTTLGTPVYMSPEQCDGSPLDGRSDIYALGVVLYELLTNAPPFQFKNLSEAVTAHLKGIMPPPARTYRAELPAAIESVLNKAMAKMPRDRYTTGGELVSALRGVRTALTGQATQVVPASAPQPTPVSQPVAVPRGFVLVVNTPGQPTNQIELSQRVVTIGRNADNDVVLPADGVSRYHARLQVSETGWNIIDLGGVNGTLLSGNRLPANQTVSLPSGSSFRVGPYTLILQAPTPVAEPHTPTGLRIVPVAEQTTQLPPAFTSTDALSLFLTQDRLTGEPGKAISLNVEVANRGNMPDRVNVRVKGLPANWLTLPTEFMNLPAHGTASIEITILPPRRSDTPAGRQKFQVELVSQRYPALNVTATGSLFLNPFTQFEARMEPSDLQLPGTVQVTVRNAGNMPLELSILGREPSRRLQFRGERGRITLEANRETVVELVLETKLATGWFDSSEAINFDVEVSVRNGGKQLLSGQARTSPIIPPILLYGAAVVLTFACVFGVLFFLFGDLLRGERPTVTATIPSTIGLTTTTVILDPVQATGTAAQATLVAATAAVFTPTVEGDFDLDGLSLSQEQIAGTDPNNPDSDGDGLTDGAEILIHGTNPRNPDTDSDLLTDGAEVNLYKTDPRNPDTDGDGIRDAIELDQGSNPLATSTPLATPTATVAGVPSATSTATPVFSPTPSQTPPPQASLTPTPLPSSTTTPMPTSTATATATATTQPTATATASPMPTPSATFIPTATQLPSLDLTCTGAAPILNGVFDVGEWGVAPLVSFTMIDNPGRLVQIYFIRDSEKLYVAFVIYDNSNDATDSLRLYFDTTGNGGDPDLTDRFFQVGRDGTVAVRAGTGDNSDGDDWDASYTSSNWQGVAGTAGAGTWLVEMEVKQLDEMPALTNPFRFMAQVLFNGEGLVNFPEQADSTDAGSWQLTNNITCP